jgi:hypothetical protein
MDGTSIVLGNDQVIEINKGDALIARGDLVHAGNSYAEDNLRLHYYFDHPSYTIEFRGTHFCHKLHKKEKEQCSKEPVELKRILDVAKGNNLVLFNKNKKRKNCERLRALATTE